GTPASCPCRCRLRRSGGVCPTMPIRRPPPSPPVRPGTHSSDAISTAFRGGEKNVWGLLGGPRWGLGCLILTAPAIRRTYYNPSVPISRRSLLAAVPALPLLARSAANPLKIVVAGGHPGDPECGCAGTIARYSDLGHAVVLLYLNRGE